MEEVVFSLQKMKALVVSGKVLELVPVEPPVWFF